MLNRNGIASKKLYYYHKLFVFVNVTVEIIRVMKPIMSVKHYKRYNKIISWIFSLEKPYSDYLYFVDLWPSLFLGACLLVTPLLYVIHSSSAHSLAGTTPGRSLPIICWLLSFVHNEMKYIINWATVLMRNASWMTFAKPFWPTAVQVIGLCFMHAPRLFGITFLTNERHNKKPATIEMETHAVAIHFYYLFVSLIT